MMGDDGNDNEGSKKKTVHSSFPPLLTIVVSAFSIIRIRVAANIARREFSKNSTTKTGNAALV